VERISILKNENNMEEKVNLLADSYYHTQRVEQMSKKKMEILNIHVFI